MEDPLLQQHTSLTIEPSTPAGETVFTSGLYVVGLDQGNIDELGIFFNTIYSKCAEKRQVTRNAATMLQGAIFALGSKDMGNIEWKEHCAASLREVLHEWKGHITGEFREFYTSSPKAGETEVYNQLTLHYQYFSGVAHHEAAGIMGALRSIKKDQTLKLEDCYTDEVFIDAVKNYFNLLSQLLGFSQMTSDV